MNKPISPAEYARSRKARGLSGSTPQAVSNAIRDGRISTDAQGLIDPEQADADWEMNTRKRIDLHTEAATAAPTAQSVPPATSPASNDWAASKARTEAAVAELKEIELAERKGQLIDRDGVERAAQKLHRTLRDALVEVLPAQLAPELAGMSEPWAIECRLREATRDTLAAIVGELRAEVENA